MDLTLDFGVRILFALGLSLQLRGSDPLLPYDHYAEGYEVD